MKDEHDNRTIDLKICETSTVKPLPAPQARIAGSVEVSKRPYVQHFERAHVVTRSTVRMVRFDLRLNADEQFLPVSHVAKDWQVSPRRIRSLLAAGRLAGRILANGYWEVRYPYFLSLGTRGPALKHQQRVSAKQERRTV